MTKKEKLIKDLMDVLFDPYSCGGSDTMWTLKKLNVEDLKYLYLVKTKSYYKGDE